MDTSECEIPRPAVMRLTSPGRTTATVPSESRCSTSPLNSHDTVASPQCGWGATSIPPLRPRRPARSGPRSTRSRRTSAPWPGGCGARSSRAGRPAAPLGARSPGHRRSSDHGTWSPFRVHAAPTDSLARPTRGPADGHGSGGGAPMGLFDRLEAGLERAVQGTFAKHLRANVHPVEIASHIRRAMDDRAVTGSGRAIVPNVFAIEPVPRRLRPAGTRPRRHRGGPRSGGRGALRQPALPARRTHRHPLRGARRPRDRRLQAPALQGLTPSGTGTTGQERAAAPSGDGGTPATHLPLGPPAPPLPPPVPPAAPVGSPRPGGRRRLEATRHPAPVPAGGRRVNPADRPWLDVDGERYPLMGAITILGRDDAADIILDDPGISRATASCASRPTVATS